MALTTVFRHYARGVAETIRAGVVVEVDGNRVRVGARLPESEIEVLVQETFTRAFGEKARLSYDGVRPYGAWLATIARNLLVDRARTEQHNARALPFDDIDSLPAAEAPDPTWRIEAEQIQQIVTRVKHQLREPDAAIFAARIERGMSFSETAKSLGLSEIVVRRRDTRLRAKLLIFLRKEGFLEHAKIKIGQSLLGRKTPSNVLRPEEP